MAKKKSPLGGGFLSTPSARRATALPSAVRRLVSISIHALREEGDEIVKAKMTLTMISIHALREEGDSDHQQDLQH